jgi:hypothetical protein
MPDRVNQWQLRPSTRPDGMPADFVNQSHFTRVFSSLVGFAQLRNKTSDELRVMQKHSQDQLKRYEQAVQTAIPIIDQRTQRL